MRIPLKNVLQNQQSHLRIVSNKTLSQHSYSKKDLSSQKRASTRVKNLVIFILIVNPLTSVHSTLNLNPNLPNNPSPQKRQRKPNKYWNPKLKYPNLKSTHQNWNNLPNSRASQQWSNTLRAMQPKLRGIGKIIYPTLPEEIQRDLGL